MSKEDENDALERLKDLKLQRKLVFQLFNWVFSASKHHLRGCYWTENVGYLDDILMDRQQSKSVS